MPFARAHPHARRSPRSAAADPSAASTPFAWWCVIRGLLFTYIYGSRQACQQALTALDPADCLLKGYCAEATEAEAQARAAAAELDLTYAGLGHAWAVPAEDFTGLPPRPPLPAFLRL